ncbi:hypothetical protein K438DRAFT_1775211 [Mycena galopus ATCC 62051]|nr:hypothetical protein K438DRAFT_1775211 [Mycena galopus ATCC 62051]
MYIRRIRAELKGTERETRVECSPKSRARSKDSFSAEKVNQQQQRWGTEWGTAQENNARQGLPKAALDLAVGKESAIKIIAIPTTYRLDATFAVGGVQNVKNSEKAE